MSIYRADLDGLRAVAIICVVLFHAYPQLLAGGLMGVDLFFVLSGYLITQLLQRKEMSSNGNINSVLRFYRNRLQRLYPPLLLFLSTVLVLGWFVLSTSQYSALWSYALSASLFSTNVYLAVDQGVLSDRFTNNPFLHLWSLGIEGQLYLLWPWLVLHKHKYKNNKIFLAMILSVSSAVVLYLIGADRWLFYAPSSRLFEMAIGAMLAFYGCTLSKRFATYSNWIIIVCFILGLIVINPYESYPNITVILPIVAVVLFILNSPQNSINKALSIRPLVYIGRISYSWYLWHWGLFALYQTYMPMWLLIVISFGLAALSYHFVELPLQHRRREAS